MNEGRNGCHRANTASEALADFAARLRWGDVQADVAAKVKRHLLDLLGVALASSPMPFAQMVLRAATESGGRGKGTVIGFPDRLPPAWAALVNGTLAHGLDYDDTHLQSVVHVSASVVPAALAAADTSDTDGKRFLTALVVGLESAVRIGMVARGAFHDRGFHPTGICGTYASALAAGKLAGLDAAQLSHAVGLCGSMAAGSLEFLSDGSWAKRLHPGWAAHGGLVAARLAQQGFTGPRGALDGRFGLYRSHLGDRGWDIGALTRDLGQRWELLDIALKPYPCCHFSHAFIDCAARLRDAPGFTPDRIAAIDCFVAEREMPIICEPLATKRVPRTDYDAKFSLPYVVSSMLVRGHVDVDDFTEEAIRDPAVLGLARRIECHPDPQADYPRRFPGHVRVTLADGRSVEEREAVSRGCAERPLDDEAVREKFRRNAARALPAKRAAALIAAVEGLESSQDTRALRRGCRGHVVKSRSGR